MIVENKSEDLELIIMCIKVCSILLAADLQLYNINLHLRQQTLIYMKASKNYFSLANGIWRCNLFRRLARKKMIFGRGVGKVLGPDINRNFSSLA